MRTRRVLVIGSLVSAVLLSLAIEDLLAADISGLPELAFRPMPASKRPFPWRHYTLSPPYGVVLRQGQGEVRGIIHKAIRRAGSQHWQQAIDLFSKAIDMARVEPEAYFNRAVCRDIVVDKGGAITDYTQFLELCPDDAEAYCLRGVPARRGIAESMADFDRAIQLDGEYGFAFYARGIRRMQDAGDPHGAVRDFTSALKCPAVGYEYIEAFTNRAVARFCTEDAVGAIDDCTEAVGLAGSTAHSRARRRYGKRGERREAEQLRNFALTNRGLMYAAIGNFSAAAADLNVALTDRFHLIHSDAYLQRAYVRTAVGDWVGARKDFESVRQAATKDILMYPEMPHVYQWRSDARAGLGDKVGALADLRERERLLSGFKNEYYYQNLERISELESLP